MTTNAERLRAYRLKAVAEGKCYICRARPQKPGRRTCVECLASSYARKVAAQKANRAAGRCRCGAQPAKGLADCSACASRRRETLRRQYERRKAAGLCVKCGGPGRPGRIQCAPCAAAHTAAKQETFYRLLAAGLCGCCGEPNPREAQLCEACSARQYQYQRASKQRRAS